MDNIQAVIKKRFDHDAAKQILSEKYEAKMLFAAFGGMWKAGPDLLSILFQYNDCPTSTQIVLLDEYGNPCQVMVFELYDLTKERWQEQMNAWYLEFGELQNKR